MEKNLIQVSSITYAMKGKEILLSKGIRAYIQRVTENRLGCGYGIFVPDDFEKAVEVLKMNNIRVLGLNDEEMPP